jgi:hypothetical protein
MKFKHSSIKRTFFLLSFSVLLIFVYSSSAGIVFGQKKPTSLKLDVDGDDSKICRRSDITNSQFCRLFRSYNRNISRNDFEAAQADRNEMIEIVRGQVDTYYKLRKDGRRFKINVFQTILDFLGIGGNLAATIMNGERAKTIVTAAVGSLGEGRGAYSKNFQLLQTQVLINKMNANRAQILIEIVGNIDKPVRGRKPSETYSWYAAKNDLRRYLLAGTFENALDTLVEETGADAESTEKKLRKFEKRTIVAEPSEKDLNRTDDYFTTLSQLEKALKSESTKTDATDTLKDIFDELVKEPKFKTFFKINFINRASSGNEIVKGIRLLLRQLDTDGEEELVQKVENIVIQIANGEEE